MACSQFFYRFLSEKIGIIFHFGWKPERLKNLVVKLFAPQLPIKALVITIFHGFSDIIKAGFTPNRLSR
jgi:hypothetical protein